MSLPALRQVRLRFPQAHIAVLAHEWVAGLYARESFADRIIPYPLKRGLRDLSAKWKLIRELEDERFDCALLLPNSFESAAAVWLARIPRRIGYNRDGRGLLLTQPVPRPEKGATPRHESFYYLELLRRAGWLERLPEEVVIRLEGIDSARQAGEDRMLTLGLPAPVIGLSPGAAYGGAKRWLPERFAQAAGEVASRLQASVAIFGTPAEKDLCQDVLSMLPVVNARNLAGETSLKEFIELAAACRVFLTNDSGSMHIASALGVPTVAIFGATDHVATGPTGEFARVVREPVECSPCLLRECPIDHRCMTRIPAERVARTALDLLK